jgi:hypothetical protein
VGPTGLALVALNQWKKYGQYYLSKYSIFAPDYALQEKW